MLKIVLNGIELNRNDWTGEKGSQVEIRDSEDDETRVRNVSQTYTMTGAAYEMIEAAFIVNPNARNNEMTVKLYDSGCCDEDVLLFEGRLTAENVKWCYGECSVDVVFEEFTDETRAMQCIKSTLIYDNHAGFQQQQHPRLAYCVEVRPDILFFFILNVGAMLNNILAILTPVVAFLSIVYSVLQAIQNALGTIGINIDIAGGFDGNNATSLLDEYNEFKARLNENLIGCGRKHPSPFVRSYINNVCSKCGLQFSSSIYNNPSSPYWNATYMNAPIAKGTKEDSFWLDKNRPNKTLDMLLNELKLVHNGKWEIDGNTLYFERKDFFNNGAPYVNYEQLEELKVIDEKLCFEFREETRAALLDVQYQLEAIDTGANDALNDYNEVIEWNQPFSELQSGRKEVLLPFSAAKFRDDGTTEEAFDLFWLFENYPFGIGSAIQANENVMIMEKHMAALPRLVIIDPNESIANAKVKRTSVFAQDRVICNYDYQFNVDDLDPTVYYASDGILSDTLYKRSYSIDNPKLSTDYGKTFTFSFRYSCEQLQSVFEARYVQLPIGGDTPAIGRITQLTVNLDNKTISITGNV
jgi:hypothetical protein